jgi:ferrochelatase
MKTGILLVNLGTPDSPRTPDVRRYLREFLSDRRVLDINPIGRWALVNLIIAPFRGPKSAKLYSHIWTGEGSPLLIHGLALTRKLQASLGDDYVVAFGMRYQNPALETALDVLRKALVDRIVVVPLYPQYSSAANGSTIEAVMKVISK